MMLLQLKRYEVNELSVFEQCAAKRRMGCNSRGAVIAGCVARLTAMRKMGCNSRGAVIAGCVARLKRHKESWGDAMKPLTGVALRHRTTFDAYIENIEKTNHPASKDTRLMCLPLEERKAVFDYIIGDLSVSVKDASPQVHARTSPEVERFVVTCYPSLSAPKCAVGVVNSLTITAANSAAAFYPTEWQNEAFLAPMAISEVMQLLPVLPKKENSESESVKWC
ncbi:Hypothetical protein, putative [Bodo saltans]|uniref:Uncharacterized protein n=1 Tax=Bodo saltans TaxID=75058 RepID=A0A0S4J4P6_BODSA|nr:Hypothetical protein, putative [Bodo saltans]|eukprot:CUG20586.1 Hypothetical protein, putative [Bodo saltans]